MVARKRLSGIECSIARSLDVIGEWWTPLVLRDIFYGLHRFEEIATDLPIARNVLASRLAALVEAGLLVRRQYSDGPPRHEYHPTAKGEETFGVLLALMSWGDRWTNPDDTPPVTVLCRSCDTQTHPVVACDACGAALTPSTVGVRPNHGQQTPRTKLVLKRA